MVTYKRGDTVPLFVNSLTSPETLLPIEYYHLPFCSPPTIEYKSENLGEYLTANRIENSPYELKFLEHKECAVLCHSVYTQKQINKFGKMVKEKYRINWILDNLPVSSIGDETNELGFPLGEFDKNIDVIPKLNNHVKIRISYNNIADVTSSDEGRIVDFQVIPYSYEFVKKNIVEGETPDRMDVCDRSAEEHKSLYMTEAKADDKEAEKATTEVYWTYSVEWIEDNTREWRTRWDIYFEVGSGSDEVHWFSIVNALLIVLFLSGMVGMILMRSLHRDISRYNRVPTEEERMEEREESGWKLVHADVFRPPTYHPMLFCVMMGTGCQVLSIYMSID